MVAWLVLLFASAGVLHHSGIKIPFFAFFAHDRGIRVQEAPWQHAGGDGHRRLPSASRSASCPAPLYALLPYPVDFDAVHGDARDHASSAAAVRGARLHLS